jgi:hypothetical protein
MTLHPIPFEFLTYEEHFLFFLSVYRPLSDGTVRFTTETLLNFEKTIYRQNKDKRNRNNASFACAGLLA